MRIILFAALAVFSALACAQEGSLAFTEMPPLEMPPREFATAEEHYNYLYEQADGGTQHTMETIPVWDGLWVPGGDTVAQLFLDGGTRRGGGIVREGVLTPEYEAQFKARRAEMAEIGRQRFDRLTRCEFPGVPRWLREPYVKEFVNMPTQTWMLNDFMNEWRRIYIGKEHVNIDGAAFGDRRQHRLLG